MTSARCRTGGNLFRSRCASVQAADTGAYGRGFDRGSPADHTPHQATGGRDRIWQPTHRALPWTGFIGS